MEILNSLKDLLGGMSNGLRAAVIIVAIIAGLGYVYLSKEDAPAPTKSVGAINQGTGSQSTTDGGSNTSNNNISF